MSDKLKQYIKSLVKEEIESISQAPKMGDIKPTDQSDNKRPGMKNRPKDGMDIKQHKKMLWSESIDFKNNDEIMELVGRIRQMLSFGLSREEIVNKLSNAYNMDDIYLAYYAAKVLSKEGALEEFNAMGAGAVAGYTGPLGMDLEPIHRDLWSGDKPQKNQKKKKKIG